MGRVPKFRDDMIMAMDGFDIGDHVDPEDLFNLLDDSRDGVLEIDEFINGMMMIKGSARSLDVHRTRVETLRVKALVQELCQDLAELGIGSSRSMHEKPIHIGHIHDCTHVGYA